MSLRPDEVEEHLSDLLGEIIEGQKKSVEAENKYANAKWIFETRIAKARVALSSQSKMRVGEIQDHALIKCEAEYQELLLSEALAKIAKTNLNSLMTQVDIIRSIGASVRASLTI